MWVASTKMAIRWTGDGFGRVCPRKWRFGGREVMNVGGVHGNGDSVDEWVRCVKKREKVLRKRKICRQFATYFCDFLADPLYLQKFEME